MKVEILLPVLECWNNGKLEAHHGRVLFSPSLFRSKKLGSESPYIRSFFLSSLEENRSEGEAKPRNLCLFP